MFKAIREEKNDNALYSRLETVTQELLNEDSILFKDLEHLINDAINSLPVDIREIFLLSRNEGLTYSQIAEHKNYIH